MENTKYSFIVPMYNVEKYIEECLDSILMQDYYNYEVILVNDGSTDDSELVCKKYLKNKHIKYYNKENGGLSDARNYAILKSSGEYLIFIDSDDYYENKFLKELNTFIDNSNPDIVIINLIKYYESTGKKKVQKKLKNINYEDFFKFNIFKACAGDKIVRRSFIYENNFIFPKGLLSEDILWCGDLLSANPKIEYFGMPFYVYRQRNGSISKSVTPKHIEDIFFMIDKLLSKYDTYIIKQYLSYEYACLLSNIAKLDAEQIKIFKSSFRKYDYLLLYSTSKKASLVKIFYKCMGYNLTCKILKLKIKF